MLFAFPIDTVLLCNCYTFLEVKKCCSSENRYGCQTDIENNNIHISIILGTLPIYVRFSPEREKRAGLVNDVHEFENGLVSGTLVRKVVQAQHAFGTDA